MAGMVDITPKLIDSAQLINGYGEGFFTISNKRFESAVLVFSEKTFAHEAKCLDEINPAEFVARLQEYDAEMEIVLIGSGGQVHPIPVPLKAALKGAGIGCDVMDSRAVCRTFNILLSEERKVAAFMLPIS